MTVTVAVERESLSPLARIDAGQKVVGRVRYITDMIEVDALYVKVVRSTQAHARICSLDSSEARAIPGVQMVITAKDIPGENLIGFFLRDQPLLAGDVTRFAGEALALVVAEDPVAARRAVEAIKVDYEPLPAVLDIDEALKTGSVKLGKDGNIKESYQVKKGDVDDGFKKSDVILEGRYSFPYQDQAYLETEAALAIPSEDGLTIMGSIQVPFSVERAVRSVLGKSARGVRIIQAPTGGAFGGKEDAPDEVCSQAALAAFLTNKPCLLAFNRKESMIFHPKRHPGYIRRKIGATRSGKIMALQEYVALDGGAYMALTPRVLFQAVIAASGPYRYPNVLVDGVGVYTNKVPSSAFRGFGKPQGLYAAELQMDELADELKMDPAELRLKNLLQEGDETAWGQRLSNGVGIRECVRRAMEMSNWTGRRRTAAEGGKIRRGLGMALAVHGNSLGPYGFDIGSAILALDQDGYIVVKVALTEYGQGIHTGWVEIVRRALNVDPGIIKVAYADTGEMYDTGPTVASRSTVVGGRALYEAAVNFKSALLREASSILEVLPNNLIIAGDKVVNARDPSVYVEIKEIAKRSEAKGLQIRGEAWINMNQGTSWNREKGQGSPFRSYSFAAHVAEVEVNTDTGKVDVINYFAVHDSGKILNRKLAESQVHGGVVQGLGYALTEDLVFRDGRLATNSFLDYMIPTFADVPAEIAVDFVEPYNEDGPFGAKGLGEVPIEPVAPAVGNAIRNAIGISVRDFPFTGERVLMALNGGSRL